MPLTVVQSIVRDAASLTSLTVTLAQATGAGNTLVVCVSTNASVSAPQVSGITLGGAAENFRAAVTPPQNVSFGGALWYDPGCGGGQTAVTVTCTGGAGANAAIYASVYEITGVLTADQVSSSVSAGASSFTSGTTPTTTAAAEIFIGYVTASASVPVVTGAGTWTTITDSGGSFDQVSGYQVVAAQGTATFSGTSSGAYLAAVATFSPGPQNATSAASVSAQVTSTASVSDG